MRRRQALRAGSAIAGFTALSGCFGDDSDSFRTEGNDDEPLDVDPAELVLPIDSVPEVLDPGWSEMDWESSEEPMFHDADAARQYVPYDEDEGFHMESGTVTTGTWAFADVEAARESYSTHPYQDGWGFEDREIAVESMAGSGDTPSQFRVIFRDANVIGGLQYENDRIGDGARENRGLELAVLMHERWRND